MKIKSVADYQQLNGLLQHIQGLPPDRNPYLELPNVVLTPHVASYSEEGDVAHQKRTAEILLQVVKGGLPERKVVVNKDLYDQLANSLQATPV